MGCLSAYAIRYTTSQRCLYTSIFQVCPWCNSLLSFNFNIQCKVQICAKAACKLKLTLILIGLVVVVPVLSLTWNFWCRPEWHWIHNSPPASVPQVLWLSVYNYTGNPFCFLILLDRWKVKTWSSTLQVLLTTSSFISHRSFPLSAHYRNTRLPFQVWTIRKFCQSSLLHHVSSSRPFSILLPNS